MFSRTVEYALRAMVCLGGQEDRLTTPQIAEAGQIPAGYLPKVLQSLGRDGLVESRRGLGGGFSLARAASEISILDIINAIDPMQRLSACPLGLEAHADHLCPLHQRLDDATAMVEEAFRQTSLADLLTPDGPDDCVFPLLSLTRKRESRSD